MSVFQVECQNEEFSIDVWAVGALIVELETRESLLDTRPDLAFHCMVRSALFYNFVFNQAYILTSNVLSDDCFVMMFAFFVCLQVGNEKDPPAIPSSLSQKLQVLAEWCFKPARRDRPTSQKLLEMLYDTGFLSLVEEIQAELTDRRVTRVSDESS